MNEMASGVSHPAPADQNLMAEVETIIGQLAQARLAIGQQVFGQESVVENSLITLLAGGHGLIVGVPGLAKTRLVDTLGKVLGLDTRRIQFINFTDADFVTAADVTAGRSPAAQLNWIRDPFYNTSIACVTDANLNGVINGSDTTGGFPPVTVADSTTVIRVTTTTLPPGTTGGVHAGVIFYSAPPGATTEADLILSWK
jgi:hypothetical protein